MRNNGIGLGLRAQKFVTLMASAVAVGEMSVAEAYRQAGYKNDSANAAKAAKHHAESIVAERVRLGIVVEPASPEAIEDEDKQFLIDAQKRLLAEAISAENLPVQRATLRELAKLMKQPGRGGRPSTQTQPAKPSTPVPERMSPEDSAAFFAQFFTDEENEQYARDLAEEEVERDKLNRGEPNNYYRNLWRRHHPIAEPGAEPDEPITADLKPASPIAIAHGEAVKRL